MARRVNRINNEQSYSVRELRRIAEAPLRRPLLVIVPLVAVLVGAVALSFFLPPRYRSTTLILVAPDSMPNSFVQTMTTEKIKDRLQTLRQEVQSRTRLEMVARELDPYRIIGKEPLVTTIERMRDNVTVTVKGSDAFSIEFEHPDPKMAMLVADRLTTLFMEDVVGAREKQVSVAYQFIDSQLQEARGELEKKEQALAEYKERHMGALPEQVNSNLATLQRLQLEHQTVSDGLRRAADTLAMLESGMAPSSRGSAGPATPEPPDSLSVLRAARADLLTRYTAEHPDVKALDARIAPLEKTKAAAAAAAGSEIPVDPVAAQAKLRILEARRDVDRLRQQLVDVENQIHAFEARVEATPRREQEILSLTRGFEELRDNYSSLLQKKMEARMAARLEHEAKGQQFRVIDPAYVPERPSFPNPPLIALLGAFIGLFTGVGLAVVADFLDSTIKDAEGLSEVLPSYPVLAVIPYVKPRLHHQLAREAEQAIPLGRWSAVGDTEDSGARRPNQGTGNTKTGAR